jgi:hypothetical protein
MRHMQKPANDEVTQTIQVFGDTFNAASAERIVRQYEGGEDAVIDGYAPDSVVVNGQMRGAFVRIWSGYHRDPVETIYLHTGHGEGLDALFPNLRY